MKYVRAVFAVPDERIDEFYEVLDWFIEEGSDVDDPDDPDPTADQIVTVEGAYVSGLYDARNDAIHGIWKDKEYK